METLTLSFSHPPGEYDEVHDNFTRLQKEDELVKNELKEGKSLIARLEPQIATLLTKALHLEKHLEDARKNVSQMKTQVQ